jgi:hypothetical protein
MRKHCHLLDTSVGVSERYDFAVHLAHAFVLRTTSGHRIPRPTFLTMRNAPLGGCGMARINKGVSSSARSEIFLANRLDILSKSGAAVIPGRCVSIEPGVHLSSMSCGTMDSAPAPSAQNSFRYSVATAHPGMTKN